MKKFLLALATFLAYTTFQWGGAVRLLALPIAANPITYYVDNCVTIGRDSNNGTSTTTPWLTVAHVNAQTFNPGDSILFESACTWSGTDLIPTSSGSVGHPITFGAYGSGAQPLLKGAANTINITNRSYLTIQGLHLGTCPCDTVYMNAASNVVVSDNEINGGGCVNVLVGYGSNNITIAGNRIHDPGTNGDRSNIGIGETDGAVHDIQVQNNDIYGGQGSHIVVASLINAPYNITIRYNLMHDASMTGPNGGSNGILLVDGAIVAAYNVIWNNPLAGIGIEPNLCANCTNPTATATLYGNTVYNNGFGLYYSEQESNAHGAVLADNNILFDNNGSWGNCCSGGAEIFKFNSGGTWTSDYNVILHPTNASRTFYWTQPPESDGGGIYSSTLAAWQSVSGNDKHSIQGDPLLVDPRGGVLTLQFGSPAINTGTNLGDAYQLALSPNSFWPLGIVTANQNSVGLGWEIGAFVFGPEPRPASPATLSITVN